MQKITIKELHRTTGEHVRRAAASKFPVMVTDHGKPIAVLANPSLLKPTKKRKRVLLPEFIALMAQPQVGNTQEDLDAVRGDR
jgi:prevent-host-death family protein